MTSPTFKRVLVVEDDLSLRPFWELVIARHSPSAHVEWAASSERVQAKMRNSDTSSPPYDLIISDIFLAGHQTGIDLLQSMEEIYAGTKMLLVSISQQSDLMKRARESLPNVKFLAKPLSVAKCERALTELIGPAQA